MTALATAEPAADTVSFFDYSREELASFLSERFGVPAFRARQLFEWVYRHEVRDIEQMTNISKAFRAQLAETFNFPKAEVVMCQKSVDGTRKYLLRLPSGLEVESVMIKQGERYTLCISSQYGCGMGCTFCQTGTMGFRSHLSTTEILLQALAVREDSAQYGETFHNIVFMGMGEPLHNFANVTRALKVFLDDLGFALGPRRITVSTVGLVPAIKKFGALDLGVNLAVSLNATTDEVRSQIMPMNKRFPIAVLLETLKDFPLSGRKRITIEYVMLGEVNDTDDDLYRLRDLMSGMRVKVNLIPYNDNAGLGFKTPANKKVFMWCNVLNEEGVSTTIRWSKGVDIDAACGQLVTGEKAAARREEQGETPGEPLATIGSARTRAAERMNQPVRF